MIYLKQKQKHNFLFKEDKSLLLLPIQMEGDIHLFKYSQVDA